MYGNLRKLEAASGIMAERQGSYRTIMRCAALPSASLPLSFPVSRDRHPSLTRNERDYQTITDLKIPARGPVETRIANRLRLGARWPPMLRVFFEE
jgi:hypothetical protein